MPRYDYKCYDCEEIFEVYHKFDESCKECSSCNSNNVKKIISAVNFFVKGGTPKFASHGYTGKNQELVKNLKGNKNYRDGYRNEVEKESKNNYSNWKEEQNMKKSNEIFQKMKAVGEKMTKAEKEKIKAEFGIKKGMKAGKIS
jgi:putative FmdB family regulatory protein